jgi:choline dehydrogenase-like flavoprotein
MLIDARTLPADEVIEADVCIVGAGPAGITLALELIESGARVCLLESGGLERQPAPAGESVGYPYFPLAEAGVRAFGGSSLHWGSGDGDFWYAVPLDRLDFERRPGIPYSGWPFDRTRLVPFYQRAAAIYGLGSFVYSADAGDDDDVSTHLNIRAGQLVSSFIEVSPATVTPSLGTLKAAASLRLLLNATAVAVQTEPDGRRVIGVRAVSAPGRTFVVRARTTVLAAGGLGNARLLLQSGGQDSPAPGNEHDLVGRFFMEHLAIRSGVVVPTSPTLLGNAHLYEEGNRGGITVIPTLRLHESQARQEQLLNVAFLIESARRAEATSGVRSAGTIRRNRQLQPRPGQLLGHTRNVARHAGDVARTFAHRSGLVHAPDDVLLLRVQAEQAPNPESRVTLAEARDQFGLRKLRLNWQLTDLDRASVRRTQQLLDQALQDNGLGRVDDILGDEHPPALVLGIYHHMGTTRMSDDPRQGVADGDGQVHGSRDLYVTGTSVFPTAGWANPTFTVLALAIKLGDHLKGRLALK